MTPARATELELLIEVDPAWRHTFGVGEYRELLAIARTVKPVVDFFEGPCRLDHDGACQTHLLEQDCSIARLRSLV